MERGGRSSEVPLHVPGHKRGAAPPPGLDALMGGALRYDLTELAGTPALLTALVGAGDEEVLGCARPAHP